MAFRRRRSFLKKISLYVGRNISVGGGVLGPKESSSVVDAVGLKSGRRNRHIMFAAPSAMYDRSVFPGRAGGGELVEDIEMGCGAVSTV